MRLVTAFATVFMVFAARGQTIHVVTTNYMLTTSDCSKVIQLGDGGTGPFTLSLPSTTGFTPPCRIEIINGDSTRGKYLSGSLVAAQHLPAILFPNQSFSIVILNDDWAVDRGPGRWLAPTGTVFHVDAALGNDANDGLAAAAGGAWQTPQQAVNVLKLAVDFGQTVHGGPLRVDLAPGRYNRADGSGIFINGPFWGAAQPGQGIDANSCPIVFEGDADDLNAVTINGAAGDGLTAIGGTFVCIQNLKITGVSSDIGAGGASVIRFGDVVLGASDGHKIRSGHGSAVENYPGSTIHLSGNSPSVFWGLVDGNVYITGANIIIDSDFTVAQTALAESGGGLYYRGNSLRGPGTINGPKFKLDSGGYIYTGTNDVSLLPGTMPGILGGGVYDDLGAPAYAAGVWKPSFAGAFGGGASSYQIQEGSWEQTGRQVVARFTVVVDQVDNPAGTAKIVGLPVAAVSASNDYGQCSFSFYGGIALDAGFTSLGAGIVPGNNSIAIVEMGPGIPQRNLSADHVGSGATLVGACNYRAY